jgi:hypothetical protein
MADLSGHEAGNGGYSQRKPTACPRVSSTRREKLRFLGLDVHAETIAVAVAEPDGEVRSLGTIANREESVRKLIKIDPDALTIDLGDLTLRSIPSFPNQRSGGRIVGDSISPRIRFPRLADSTAAQIASANRSIARLVRLRNSAGSISSSSIKHSSPPSSTPSTLA